MSFTFVDLFAGIGGFHAALGAMGGKCVYASEWDKDAARIYERNWNLKPEGDITLAANDQVMDVPPHDVLVGGFPCQPFSKSGKQLGMEETRGTLFWNIARIIEVRKPTLVLLENVRNLAGPRHTHEWAVIMDTLRKLGYRVSSKPMVVSPHLIRPEFGGRPQVRDRVFIAATRVPNKSMNSALRDIEPPSLESVTHGWNPQKWNLQKDLPLDKSLTKQEKDAVKLSETEIEWITAWDEFVVLMKERLNGKPLPGFPIWVDDWVLEKKLEIDDDTPKWKSDFLKKNAAFYTLHKSALDKWLKKWDHLQDFPPSRRMFEWQAQDTENLWGTIMHFRPSGIRAKKPTYVPALVAITQTSIIGKLKRRLTVREAARLQGFPDWFDFAGQADRLSYKQLGNAVNIGAVFNVIRAQVIRDIDLLGEHSVLARAVLGAPSNPDLVLGDHAFYHSYEPNDEPVEIREYGQLRLIL
jgi:DNA (cytosine-5)-methyltransferase 1